MIPEFQPADYLLCGLTLAMAVLGLFRGFSGTLGFALGTAAAVFAAMFGWPLSEQFTAVLWQRAAGVLVVTLLAFGLVRVLVRKFVVTLLARPSDALFGFLLGAALGVLLPVAWALSGLWPDYSHLVRVLSAYVR